MFLFVNILSEVRISDQIVILFPLERSRAYSLRSLHGDWNTGAIQQDQSLSVCATGVTCHLAMPLSACTRNDHNNNNVNKHTNWNNSNTSGDINSSFKQAEQERYWQTYHNCGMHETALLVVQWKPSDQSDTQDVSPA